MNEQSARQIPSSRAAKRGVDLGMRLPFDVMEALDRLSATRAMSRTQIVTAVLRAHFGLPDPAAAPPAEYEM